MCVCARARACVRVHVRVCVHMRMCVCVCVCVCGKSKVSFNTSFDYTAPQSFELGIQGSHPSLYIAKKLYQFVYFWSILEVYRKC